MSQGYPENFD